MPTTNTTSNSPPQTLLLLAPSYTSNTMEGLVQGRPLQPSPPAIYSWALILRRQHRRTIDLNPSPTACTPLHTPVIYCSSESESKPKPMQTCIYSAAYILLLKLELACLHLNLCRSLNYTFSAYNNTMAATLLQLKHASLESSELEYTNCSSFCPSTKHLASPTPSPHLSYIALSLSPSCGQHIC
jgi:hypothetical protein